MALKITKTVKGWFSGLQEPDRPQMVAAMTEDGRLVDLVLPVLKGCCIREESMEAWEIDPLNLVVASPKGERKYTQVITERSYKPIPLWSPRPKSKLEDEKTLTRIAESTTEQTLVRGQRRAQKDEMAHIALTIFCVFAIIAVCIVIQQGFQTGHFSFKFW